jgi:hypothetical protein
MIVFAGEAEAWTPARTARSTSSVAPDRLANANQPKSAAAIDVITMTTMRLRSSMVMSASSQWRR